MQNELKEKLLKIVNELDNSVKDVNLEKPVKPEFGDLTTNISLILASKLKQNPRALAETICDKLEQLDEIKKVEIAGAGFINIFLSSKSAMVNIKNIISKGDDFGKSTYLKDKNINLEYVSANPTGPLHIAGGRWAAVGSALSNLLKTQGANVSNEYYVNDAGVQIDLFIDSLNNLYGGLPVPENGYSGEYLHEIIKKLSSKLKVSDNSKEVFKKYAVKIMLDDVKNSLELFRVKFDTFFNESSLYDNNEVEKTIKSLSLSTYEKDGALWLKTSTKSDDKDRVLVKSDGSFAYFASDVTYIKNKFERNFSDLIYILGADHHGYIPRLKSAAELLGYSSENVEILIGQMVTLKENGKVLKMSKRSGKIITLIDLVEKIGVNAARYALIHSSINSSLEIDIDLWKKQSIQNPVYYVQYAHARCFHIIENAKKHQIKPSTNISDEEFEKYLNDDTTKDLLGHLNEYENLLSSVSENKQIHKVPHFLEDLAAAFHKWYKENRVVPVSEDEKVENINKVRLSIVSAVKIIIKNGLTILSVDAPNQM